MVILFSPNHTICPLQRKQNAKLHPEGKLMISERRGLGDFNTAHEFQHLSLLMGPLLPASGEVGLRLDIAGSEVTSTNIYPHL